MGDGEALGDGTILTVFPMSGPDTEDCTLAVGATGKFLITEVEGLILEDGKISIIVDNGGVALVEVEEVAGGVALVGVEEVAGGVALV